MSTNSEIKPPSNRKIGPDGTPHTPGDASQIAALLWMIPFGSGSSHHELSRKSQHNWPFINGYFPGANGVVLAAPPDLVFL
jgi:hypothetical protein